MPEQWLYINQVELKSYSSAMQGTSSISQYIVVDFAFVMTGDFRKLVSYSHPYDWQLMCDSRQDKEDEESPSGQRTANPEILGIAAHIGQVMS